MNMKQAAVLFTILTLSGLWLTDNFHARKLEREYLVLKGQYQEKCLELFRLQADFYPLDGELVNLGEEPTVELPLKRPEPLAMPALYPETHTCPYISLDNQENTIR